MSDLSDSENEVDVEETWNVGLWGAFGSDF
jgi:hypothetical protein